MKILFIAFLILFKVSVYADISLNEDIYSQCKIDRGGIKYGCVVREEPIGELVVIDDSRQLKLHYDIKYSYSCENNYQTNISIISSDGYSLGTFLYRGGEIINDASGSLSVKDFNKEITNKAKYNDQCHLILTSIDQDLAPSAQSFLHSDICMMDSLNRNISQSQIVLSLSQSLANSIGTIEISVLNSQLELLKINLNDLKERSSEPELIESILGNETSKGTIVYIQKNDTAWGKGSQELRINMNLLYYNMQNILQNENDKSIETVKSIYDIDEPILSIQEFQSTPLLYSNLNYEYSVLNGDKGESFLKPVC